MDGWSKAPSHLNQKRFRGLIFLSLHHMELVVVLLHPDLGEHLLNEVLVGVSEHFFF